MIDFIIKTLDSKNHRFSVDDEMTVQQFKEVVREQMGIETHMQRLIFCGKVLQDEKRLSEYNVNGNVVHLVQRAPPSPENRQSASRHTSSPSTNASSNPDDNMQQQIRRLMSLAGPSDIALETQHMSPTAGRMEFVRRIIGEIKSALASLRAQVQTQEQVEEDRRTSTTSEAPIEPMDSEPTAGAAPEEAEQLQMEEPAVESIQDPLIRSQAARRSNYRAIRAMRARHFRPRDLGQLLDELSTLHDQFAPYRANYVRLLRAANQPEMPDYTEQDRQSEQRTVDIVTEIMHSFAHAYHAISDITFQVGQRNPRLNSEPSIVRHAMPVQTQINVIQTTTRHPSQQHGNNASGSNNSGIGSFAPFTQTSTNTAPSTDTTSYNDSFSTTDTAPSHYTDVPDPHGNEASAQVTRGPSQPNVNINIQPEQNRYQERTGTTATVTNPSGNEAASNSQPEQNSQNQATGNSQESNRPQVLLDIENLFRGLSGALGGIEVVMSMEEIPNGGAIGVGTVVSNLDNATNAQQLATDGGVYVPPSPWGGPPSAELFQNVVSSVINQGLPVAEGVTLNVSQGQGEVQVPITQLQQGQGIQQPNAPAQGGQEQNNPLRQTPQHALHLRRLTTSRVQPISLANLIYDRFLTCDSHHARQRLQRRREDHLQQVAAQERLRAERTAVQSIEALRDRNRNFTENHIRTIVQLLRSNPTPEAWLNAVLVAVARQLFLAEPLQAQYGEPMVVPSEFHSVRLMLRNYIQTLMTRSGIAGAENVFTTVADFFVYQYRFFIYNMRHLTPLRDIDVYGSMRCLARARMPAVIATVMSDASGDMFSARFYSVFTRLFTDFCALICFCCHDGEEGLRILYRRFMEEATHLTDSTIRDTLMVLSSENLEAVINHLPTHVSGVQHYIIWRSEFAANMMDVDGVSMDVLPLPEPVREEPRSTSPPITSVAVELSQPPSVSPVPEEVTELTEFPDSVVAPVTMPIPVIGVSFTHASTSTSPVWTVQRSTSATGEVPDSPPESDSNGANNPENTDATTMPNDTTEEIRFVPPMVIVQHWGEEWMPVFSQDQQTQSSDPPEPYSDAYLTGIPAAKRRCIRQTRAPTTLDGFMNESVREAADDTGTTDNSAIRIAFREHMRNLTRTRASNSEDYDPLRYASVARFLNQTTTTKQAHPETSGTSEEEPKSSSN